MGEEGLLHELHLQSYIELFMEFSFYTLPVQMFLIIINIKIHYASWIHQVLAKVNTSIYDPYTAHVRTVKYTSIKNIMKLIFHTNIVLR